ncbi:MAG: right-handed parallel beta-helix repeat-containing protein [Phycisphaerales bacterium]|nr:MAG: right-handed parallel beta-helix repeat-containing protein [Phycisphaerales bacterium]
MKHLIIASLVVVVLAGSSLSAAVLNVPSEYPSIQEAIDASSDGDRVVVAPGLYYERINFNGKNIVLTSTDPNDPRIVGYTIINADGEGSVVTFENGENDAVLTGFTITGGAGTLMDYSDEWYKYYYGGGIYCAWGSPTITHNVITNNVVPYKRELVEQEINGGIYRRYQYERSYGGGIYCSSGATIAYNIIYNNSAETGGGIRSGYSTVTNNIIYGNSAVTGGGVYVYAGRLENNTIVGNDASLEPEGGIGGNVYASFGYDYTRLTVANNIICSAGSGGGLFHSGSGGDAIRFNNVWDNQPDDYVAQDPRTYDLIYGGTADWTGRHGNISEDPVFSSSWSQRYRLDPESPCVSAGDPNFVPEPGETDVDGDPRVYARRVDIGADEHVGYVQPLADAGVDQHILNPAPVTLDGAGSYFSDPAGMKTYQWTQTEGTPVELSDTTLSGPTFTPPAEGWYKFSLVVGDHLHSSKPDEVLVVVGNEPPVADAGPNSLWEAPGYVMLDGLESSDADPPDELAYAWTQIDGPPVTLEEPNSPTPHFECPEAGIYTFELVVGDGFVESEPDRVKIEASPFTINAESIEVATRDEDGWFYTPALSGTGVVAVLEGDDGNWQMYWADAKTRDSRIFDAGNVASKPQIDGGLAVWAAGSGYYWQPSRTSVYMADLATGEKVTLQRAGGSESYGYPVISGNKVIWLHHRNVDTGDYDSYDNRPYDIQGADISDPAHPVFFTIAEEVGHGVPYPYEDYWRYHEGFVAISGDIVVFEGDGDIFGADISDLENIEIFPICTAAERQYDPAISGNLVVWTDEREDIGDIYAADISDRNNIREFAVSAGPGWQLQPDVDGPLIVWCDGSNSGGTIWLCCVTRDYGVVEFYLPDWNYGSSPDIDGGTITWVRSYEIQGVQLDFAYGVTEGPFENQTTGWRYDYLQHAISAAADGDVIEVAPGTYQEKLHFGGKNITLTSTAPEDPVVRAATVFTGGGAQIVFDGGETQDCVFTGFTVTGSGFGIVCNGAQPTIRYCDLVGNRDAGIKLWGASKPTVTNCDISGNGIGVEMWADTSTRRILRNSGLFSNCTITGNRREGFLGGDPTLENCTVADNLGYGLSCSSPVLNNSIVYFNNGDDENITAKRTVTATCCDIQGGWPGEGNIDVDPLFVARGFWTDAGEWVPGDYHLQSDAAIGMGAYGGTTDASLAPQ